MKSKSSSIDQAPLECTGARTHTHIHIHMCTQNKDQTFKHSIAFDTRSYLNMRYFFQRPISKVSIQCSQNSLWQADREDRIMAPSYQLYIKLSVSNKFTLIILPGEQLLQQVLFDAQAQWSQAPVCIIKAKRLRLRLDEY